MQTTTLSSTIIEASDEYWKSDAGLLRRIDMIAQAFTYKIVNGAYKIYGQTYGVKWLVWYTKADERVCAICGPLHLRKYRVTWFQPRMPQHVNCRCQWGLEYTDREVETVKENLKWDTIIIARSVKQDTYQARG